MRFKPQKYRSFLLGGTRIVVIALLLLFTTGWNSNRSTDTQDNQPTSVEEIVQCTTTTTATTTTAISTTTTTTSTTFTTSVVVSTVQTESQLPITTTAVHPSTAEVVTTTYPQPIEVNRDLPITDQEYILISNVVSHEAGGNGLSDYDRSCIVAAIFNRVNDPRFPNTVEGVIYQPNQMFAAPYYRVDYYGIGFEALDRAIATYFSGQYNYGSINSWWGTGSVNVFYTI